MKIEWPTEEAQNPEGQFYQRRLSVLEIVLRLLITPLFDVAHLVLDALNDFGIYMIEALSNTIKWLDRRYSRGKDKQEQSGGYEYDPYAKVEAEREKELVKFTERVRLLVQAYSREAIVSVLFSHRVLPLFDYQHLPDTIFNIPIVWVGADDCDFALEVLSEFTSERRIITPMDSDYSSPLLSPVTYRK